MTLCNKWNHTAMLWVMRLILSEGGKMSKGKSFMYSSVHSSPSLCRLQQCVTCIHRRYAVLSPWCMTWEGTGGPSQCSCLVSRQFTDTATHGEHSLFFFCSPVTSIWQNTLSPNKINCLLDCPLLNMLPVSLRGPMHIVVDTVEKERVTLNQR